MKPPNYRDRSVFLTAVEFDRDDMFPEAIPRITKGTGLGELDLWTYRAHAKRCGNKPIAMFIWMIWHADDAKRFITDEDEDQAKTLRNHEIRPGEGRGSA